MSTDQMHNAPLALQRVDPEAPKSTRRHIMMSALECFDEQGFESTKIEDIRKRSKASIGSIYHHFGNREGLVAALYLAALDDQFALIRPRMDTASSPREAVEALIHNYLAWVARQPKLARFMFQSRHAVASGPHREELAGRNKNRYGVLLEWLSKGVDEGVIRALPRELYASLLIGQSENYCRAWLSGRVKGAPTEHAAILSDAAWRAVATNDCSD